MVGSSRTIQVPVTDFLIFIAQEVGTATRLVIQVVVMVQMEVSFIIKIKLFVPLLMTMTNLNRTEISRFPV